MTQENELIETSLNEIYRKISIQQYKTDMGFKALAEGVHDNLFVIPEYQRKYRWTKQQVEELATSLLRDLPIPPIYAFRNENGQLEILDGQQRTSALSLKLSEIELVKRSIHDTPVLLLDDVLSELDSNRQNYLLNSIHDTQTLITCTGLDEFVKNRFHINKIFKVVQGTVEERKEI